MIWDKDWIYARYVPGMHAIVKKGNVRIPFVKKIYILARLCCAWIHPKGCYV